MALSKNRESASEAGERPQESITKAPASSAFLPIAVAAEANEQGAANPCTLFIQNSGRENRFREKRISREQRQSPSDFIKKNKYLQIISIF
jgi:hypothetical protein